MINPISVHMFNCLAIYIHVNLMHYLQDDVNAGDYFGSLATGINHSVRIEKLNKEVYDKSCSTGIPRSVTFSLVQAIAGDVVSQLYTDKLQHSKLHERF